MAQKNETMVLTLAFLLTSGIAGGTLWMFRNSFARVLGSSPTPKTGSSPSSSTAPPVAVSGTFTPASTFAEVTTAPPGLFNYGGSTTWAPIRGIVDPVISRSVPQFRLRYTDPIGRTPGSGSGIMMLVEKQLSFAQSSRSLNNRERQVAFERGFTLKEIDVAIDGIAVAVHPNLKVPGITVSQLRDIYLGKIRNWKAVGGPNLPIVPYSRRPQDGGTVEFFVDHVLDKQAFGRNVQFVYSTTPGLRQVAQTLGGIYYASAPELVPQCTIKPLAIGKSSDTLTPPYQLPIVPRSECPNRRNSLNRNAFQTGDYPITRKLFVIVREDNSIDQQAGKAYAEFLLTPQGQELISRAGFVPIR